MEKQAMQTTPWDSMTATERKEQLRLQKARPIRWTLDSSLAGTHDSEGRVYVFAGGTVVS